MGIRITGPEDGDDQRRVTLDNLTRRLDTIDAAYITFREQEVGIPDPDAEEPVTLREEVAGTSQQLASLTKRVKKLEERAEQAQKDWFTVTDAETAHRWLTDLQTWVDRVYTPHFDEWKLNACWPWHPPVVADLLALQAHYTWAYKQLVPTPVAHRRAQWFGRNRTLLRPDDGGDRGIMPMCKGGKHWNDGAMVEPNPAALPDYVQWWVTRAAGNPPGLG